MSIRIPLRILPVACLLTLLSGVGVPARAGDERPPSGRALKKLVRSYLEATYGDRVKMRREADERYAPLKASVVRKLRKDLLKAASKVGPKLAPAGTNYFLGEKKGKYIATGSKSSKVLFLGLHGGGEGSADASGAQPSGLGGWRWIHPEALEATERGWTDAGTEEFVVALIEAAKREGKVDPDRIYIAGHSMGGFGAWTIGAHHADLFAGAGAYAGAPVPIWRSESDKTVIGIQEGVLPSYFSLRLHVYQSLDDPQVPPAPNVFAVQALRELKEQHPDGFDFQYHEVDGQKHAAPPGGYLPSLEWLVREKRDPRPAAFLWQPVLPWKRQFYWVYWDRPEEGALLEVRAKGGNVAEITVHTGTDDLTGLSVLLGEPLFDLDEEVVVKVGGEERFRGKVERTFSTLLLTLPTYDPHLLFDARVDL